MEGTLTDISGKSGSVGSLGTCSRVGQLAGADRSREGGGGGGKQRGGGDGGGGEGDTPTGKSNIRANSPSDKNGLVSMSAW